MSGKQRRDPWMKSVRGLATMRQAENARRDCRKTSTHQNEANQYTMAGEPEPRRSVRATKGQHTKSFDELEQAAAPKKRQTKKSRKAQEELEQSQEPEEVIRCVCGATEQDEDSGEAWISCETCYAWQHNVCVGVSSFEDEIPENYWCEQCRPQDHKELLEGIQRGEKPWEARRKAHEEDAANRKKKGGRKGKAKRNSDPKEDTEKETARSKSKTSPTPEAPSKSTGKQGKRKAREESDDAESKQPKLRRVSEHEAVPAASSYTPPEDLATAISELPSTRAGPAKALKKSLSHTASALQKDGDLEIPKDSSADKIAEEYALKIERAVFDTHPINKGQKEYSQQIKSLAFNLKNNSELFEGLLEKVHSPATLAVMTSEQMASSEMQKQTAEMKAKAEKQSILYTEDTGPRVRRTHKGEEIVEDDSMVNTNDLPIPSGGGSKRSGGPSAPKIKRESTSAEKIDIPPHSPKQSDERSPSQSDFDISKVFSQVKSPTAAQRRRPSAPAINTNGPGFDPEVDRLLEDDNESPPYSPTEDSQDPDVIWRGSLAMSSIADFQATAKHVGGANFSSNGPWSKLIPRRMAVAGRITQQSAIEYLCSLRYSNLTDIVVISITPVSEASRPEFNALVDYFISKNRYGVVGNKVAGNVRDTYLVPVPAGDDGHPEFMLNLVDNFIPKTRTEPMLLAVFVYRNEPEGISDSKGDSAIRSSLEQSANAPTSQRTSISGPAFSPATPHTSNGGPTASVTPVPIPQHTRPPPPAPTPPGAGGVTSPPPPVSQMTEAQKYHMQQVGQQVAQEVLGAFINVPTVQFLLPQAFQMSRREWGVIKAIYEKDPRARDDLQYLSVLLEKEAGPGGSAQNAPPANAAPRKAN